MTATKRLLPLAIIVVGIVSIVLGIIFINTGVKSKAWIASEMRLERATYGGQPQKLLDDGTHVDVDGTIEGLVDNDYEATLMSDTLKAHRADNGYYTELERDDPGRETILNALTMENSLNLARMGFGIAQFALGVGATLLVIGLGFGIIGVALQRKKSQYMV